MRQRRHDGDAGDGGAGGEPGAGAGADGAAAVADLGAAGGGWRGPRAGVAADSRYLSGDAVGPPFANSEERADHFHKHGAEFRGRTPETTRPRPTHSCLAQRVRRRWIILEVRGIWCALIRRAMNLVWSLRLVKCE